MACLSRDKQTGSTRILFVATDGKRKTVRFGKLNQKQADSVLLLMEDLIAANVSHSSPKNTTAEWLADLPETIYKRLVNVGLAERRVKKCCPTVKEWFDTYIDARQDVKTGTKTAFDQARQKFLGYVGESRLLDDVTAYDAESFKADLKSKGLSEAYARRLCRSTKQFFAAAAKKKLLNENPFEDIRCGNYTNKTRYHFVTHEEAERVLAFCPDNEWKLIFALARFGGLRIPSEMLALRWCDVDWDRERVTIHACKTEHHEDGGVRQIPLFPEIKPYLLKQFDKAEAGAEYVITEHRQTNINLRTQLERIIRRAGLVAWPKLFQNCRSSRETELCRQFPLHVVTSWLGNTPKVAQEHYLQTTDSDFQKAISGQCDESQKAAQNPAQYTPEIDGMGWNTETGELIKKAESTVCGPFRSVSNSCEIQELASMGADGFEPSKTYVNGFTAHPLWPLGHTPIHVGFNPYIDSTSIISKKFRLARLMTTFFENYPEVSK